MLVVEISFYRTSAFTILPRQNLCPYNKLGRHIM
jgi:hypothetical protein